MALTSTQVQTLLENVLFENSTLAAANAPSWTSLTNLSAYSSASALSAALAASPEMGIVQEVTRLYLGVLGRTPDAGGLQFWVNYAEQGLSPTQVANGVSAVSAATWNAITNAFTGSTEFTTRFPAINDGALVTLMYQNVLGRSPDQSGFAYWTAQLANGMSTTALVQGFTNSSEFVNNSTTAINNALIAYGVAAEGGSTPTAIGTITPTPSAGTVFNLTTSADTATGNTFNGTLAATANGVNPSTLNSFDNLTGGTGTSNVLNVNSDGTVVPTAVTLSNIQTVNIQATADQAVSAGAVANWSSVTALNITQTASAPAVNTTIAVVAPTNAALTDTGFVLATNSAQFDGLTVDGGTNISVTATGAQGGSGGAADAYIGNITVGATTAPTGTITVNATETLAAQVGGNAEAGNINVDGGTAVTVNSTVKAAVSDNGTVPTITIGANTPPTGVITVTDAAVTTANTATLHADKVTITGGSTVSVTESASTTVTTAGQNGGTIDMGAVNVTGGSATTSVSVTQAAQASAVSAAAAVTAVTGVAQVTGVTASPGVQGVTAVAAVNSGNTVSAVAAVAAAPAVNDAAVTIADAHDTSTATSTITSVSLDNYANSTFTGAALNSLSLAGTGGTLSITNGASTAATNTTLALTVNGLTDTGAGGTDNHITDVNHEITTLNVTTGATKSSLDGFYDSGLKTMTVAGNSVLTLGSNFNTTNDGALTSLSVSGAAGLTADLHGFGSALAVTTTSSGVMTLTLDDTTQTFTGSTGQDIISLAGNASKAITGGSATNNEVVLTAASSNYTAAGFGKYVTGFTTLGVNDATAADNNTYDMHGVFTGYNAIDLQSSMSGTETFTNVAAGTSLAIDQAQSGTVAYSLYTPTSTGSVNVSINTTSVDTGITVGTLSLNDSNNDGLATLNVTSNAKHAAPTNGSAAINTITTLTDTALSALTISGNAALNIGSISLGQPGLATPVGVASLSITNNTTAFNNTGSTAQGSTITTLTDDTLGNLSFAGSNNVTITNLVDNKAVNLTIGNTGSGVATITTLTTDAGASHITNGLSNLTFTGSGQIKVGTIDMAANTATTLTLTNSGTGSVAISGINGLGSVTTLTESGNIALGTAGSSIAGDTPITLTATSGVTVSAATDNAHVSLQLTGAANTYTDTISVGNANNYIVDGSTAGTVNVTVGTGSNYINLGSNSATANATTASYSVTLGTHTSSGPDWIVAAADTVTAYGNLAAAQYTVTGAASGDVIAFASDAGQALTVLTAVSTASDASVAAALQTIGQAASAASHDVAYGVYSGNTYVVEWNGTDFTTVELAGSNTITAVSGSNGAVTVGSTAGSYTAPTLPVAPVYYDGSLTNTTSNFVVGANVVDFIGTGAGATTTLGSDVAGTTSLTINDNFAGTGTLTIAPASVTHATSLTINDASSAALTLNSWTTDNALASVTLSNTGTGTLTASGITSSGLTSVSLTDHVAATISSGATTGVTVSGSSDTSAVSITLSAVNTVGNSVSLGSGADSVSIAASTNAVTNTVSFATGSNNVSVVVAGSSTNQAVTNVTLGLSHTGVDTLTYGLTGANIATAIGGTVTNSVAGDKIVFGADAAAQMVVDAALATVSSASAAITALNAVSYTLHHVDYVQDTTHNITYIEESTATASGGTAADGTLIALVGLHTVTSSGAADGTIVIA